MNKFKMALVSTGKFLKKNIYYVLIIVAIAAIGTMVGVAVTKSNKEKNESVDVVTPIENVVDEEIVDNKTDDSSSKIDTKTDDTPVVKEPVTFITPVDGAVGASFSDTELVFSKTLEQWSTHRGIDFMGEIGSDVLAVYDGIVTQIVNDPMLGYCVSISHGDGLVTRYCGLSDAVTVSVAQNVTKGTKIGEIGDTMIIESADGTHLHFETYKDGVLVNPMDYFIMNEK